MLFKGGKQRRSKTEIALHEFGGLLGRFTPARLKMKSASEQYASNPWVRIDIVFKNLEW